MSHPFRVKYRRIILTQGSALWDRPRLSGEAEGLGERNLFKFKGPDIRAQSELL